MAVRPRTCSKASIHIRAVPAAKSSQGDMAGLAPKRVSRGPDPELGNAGQNSQFSSAEFNSRLILRGGMWLWELEVYVPRPVLDFGDLKGTSKNLLPGTVEMLSHGNPFNVICSIWASTMCAAVYEGRHTHRLF